MLLYALLIQSQFHDAPLFLTSLMDLNISTIVVKNSSQAMNVLAEENHLVHLIIIDAAFVKKEPLFISQLRMHHQHRHIAVAVYNADPENRDIHEGFIIHGPDVLASLAPSLITYAAKTKAMKFDLGSILQASFQFQTLSQGYLLAQYLSNQFPETTQCLVGITELFINAVEHGNLQISYEDKSALLASSRWTEEVEARLADPRHKDKYVSVFFTKTPEKIELIVEDCGQGFKWTSFEKVDPRRLLASHGRGIMMAKSLSFSSLEYEGCGNRVKATLVLKAPSH